MKLNELNLQSIGNTIQMVGAIYAGEGDIFICMFPEDRYLIPKGYEDKGSVPILGLSTLDMDSEDWKTFLRQTDLLETEILVKAADGTLTKAIARKSQRQIDQTVSWNVYRRDKYTCRYCGRKDVPLTVDHLVRWEEGGPSIEENLLSSCKSCNRTRGNMSYGDWMRSPAYRKISEKLDWEINRANHEIEDTLAKIPRVAHIKSR